MISIEQRDIDLATFTAVKQRLFYQKMYYIITGSYAIEALSKVPIDHDDMDANVFYPNANKAIAIALTALSKPSSYTRPLQLYKQTESRLEYDIRSTQHAWIRPRRLEIHFIEATRKSTSQPNVFRLRNKRSGKIAEVNLTETSLRDSAGQEHFFLVKSLAYSIATWALRVSNLAGDQLRPPKDSDLMHLSLLLNQTFSLPEVMEAIEHHPQMHGRVKPESILKIAIDKLK